MKLCRETKPGRASGETESEAGKGDTRTGRTQILIPAEMARIPEDVETSEIPVDREQLSPDDHGVQRLPVQIELPEHVQGFGDRFRILKKAPSAAAGDRDEHRQGGVVDGIVAVA